MWTNTALRKEFIFTAKWASFKFSILSSHFIILFNVVLPRHSSISFSNMNLLPELALIIDYMIIFKFHVYMLWKFQLGLFKSWWNFCSVYRDEVFAYNCNSIFTLLSLTMRDENGSTSWNFIPGLKSWYKQPLRRSFSAKIVNHFRKRLHLGCLTGCWMRLCYVRDKCLFIRFLIQPYLLLFLDFSSDSKLHLFQLFQFSFKLIHLHCNLQQNVIGKFGDIFQSVPT